MEIIAEEMSQDEIQLQNEELQAKLSEAGIDERDVLMKAREDMTIWDSYFNENVVRGKDDMDFVLRDQWSALERSEMNRLFKPAMTFNKMYDTVKKVAGEQRKNKPDLLVRSLNGKATQQQIDLRGDLVRTISYQSQNDLVYQTAFRQALLMGSGTFEICLDYESPRSFEQIIKFDIVPDSTRTSFDPTALKPHKGDGNFCSRQFIYSKEEFYATYPWVTNPVSYSDPRTLLDFQWETRDTIVVCKYTRKEWFPLKIFKLKNEYGQTMSVTEDEWDDMQEQFKLSRQLADQSIVVGGIILKEIPKVIAERNSQDYFMRQYLMTQNQIIKFSDWPSKHLPIIFVDGDSNFIQGKQYTRSFIHEAKDAQKFVNYVGSEIAAEIKNRRREQWLGTPDNIQGYEQMWRNPELQNGILIAKADPKTGQLPVKMPPWELSQTLLQQFQRGCQDMREILGFSEAEQLQGRDISGKARRERKMEGSMSSYVFFDNLNQAIEQAGRVVLSLLPHIIGEEERNFVLSKSNGNKEDITFNKRVGDEITNALDGGEYDVEIDTGPSFAVQKEIALEMFTQTLQAFPQAFPLIADLWASQLDLQQMPTIKERFKSLVPPEVLAKEEGKPPPPKQPNPQEIMMKAEIEGKMAEVKNKQAEIQVKMQKIQLEQEELELKKAEMFLKAQEMQDKATMGVLTHELDLKKAQAIHGHDRHQSNLDFDHKAAQILADLYKHDTKLNHERHLNRNSE
jgi:hypothetical protein